MNLGSLDVEDQERAAIAVGEPFRRQYPWLETFVSSRRAAALAEERRIYAEPKVLPRWKDAVTRRFHRVLRFKRRVEDWYRKARDPILRYWAQHGLTKFDGITIHTSFEANFRYLGAFAQLPPATQKQVIREVPMFDLGAFLKLADEGVISRELIAEFLGGTLDVAVRLEKRQ